MKSNPGMNLRGFFKSFNPLLFKEGAGGGFHWKVQEMGNTMMTNNEGGTIKQKEECNGTNIYGKDTVKILRQICCTRRDS